ncbi:MAG: PQQ-dependent sugar dehydrogenase [Xanthomonadaceae bacterium]|jgi:glucose/arabinose dehydrogenase|nr:PQQ-dependent sugar dehydrogenase [Xanthomonadaceae bacterium]
MRWMLAALMLYAGLLPAQDIDLRLTPTGPEVLGTVDIVNAGDGSNRLFLVQQIGRIQVLRNGTLDPQPFLDIVDRVGSDGNEQGLLSAVFPPGFAQKRWFYVYYTDRTGRSQLDRYRLDAAGRGDPASRESILSFAQPFSNHNGGKLLFGPDGMLYLSTGDGGSANDPQNFAQNRQVLLGKILRIDTESGTTPYAIPAGNPFTDPAQGRPEIWAWGLRNPWRTSFDPATGELYIADVGQQLIEEINIQPAGAAGRNYGWRAFEGNRCAASASECAAVANPTPPDATYDHTGGNCSITGGHVYRGARYPRLVGVYLYADYCSGRVFALTRAGGAVATRQLLDTTLSIASFGVDEQGEMYLTDSERVFRISDGPPQSTFVIGPGITGTWYDPERDGQGLIIEAIAGNLLSIGWYTYAPSGGQAWIAGAGAWSGNRAEIDALITGGARFQPNFNPSEVTRTPWGRVTLTFDDCNNGRLEWNSTLPGWGSGTMRLVRLTRPAAGACS